MKRSIGITGLITVAMVLAMVPAASAGGPFTWCGNVTYPTNGSWVPDGWTITMMNLNHSEFAGQPWEDDTHQYMKFNGHCDGETDSDDDWIYVNVTSPDGRWFGEFTTRMGDMEKWLGKYIRDITVEEQELPTETFTKSLPIGWNLISLPLTPLDSSTGAVLGNDTIAYDAVKQYNATSHQFEDATTMVPGTGYFVHVTTAGDWTYEGTAYTSISATLSTGLNCVGWTNETGSALPGALSSIDGSYRYVARWNAGTQSYEVYLPDAPAVFSDFATMDRGEGYFIAATADCTLTYP